LSTGTWCISLNPFNNTLLTENELKDDCLCYLSYEGKPVKASRLFAGHEHEQQLKKLAEHFKKPEKYYEKISFDVDILNHLRAADRVKNEKVNLHHSDFQKRNLAEFSTYEEAYHRLIMDIMLQQVKSTELVLKGTGVKRIFVDGGFSKNPVYMYLMAAAFPDMEVYAASAAQASALGAALVIHQYWNKKPLPSNIIDMKLYSVTHQKSI
jgi:hypothetical protein